MTKAFASRIAVVTGASRGLGRAVALHLARAGAHVVAVARTVGGLEDLDDAIKAEGGTATLVPVDMKDFAALDRLGSAIHARWGKLDMLVANAGILGPLTPIGHVDQKSWDDVMATNLTANWRLIRSFDPLLQASAAGRVVVISSGAAHKCLAYWGPYSVSKAGVEALARTYAAETATTPIRVTIVNPGPLRTRMRAAAMPGEDPLILKTPDELAPKILGFLDPDWQETGLIYDFPQDRVLTPQMPA
jgi:NAD(P)-dependent dehydrogenase (short-subunit alcohol dehydrogenase family)